MLTYAALFLFLRLSNIFSARSSTFQFSLAIGLSLCDLTRDSLTSPVAWLPLGLFFLFFLFFPVLLFGRLGNFDDYLMAIKFLLVELLDGLLSGLCGAHSDKTIARRVGSSQDDLGGDTVKLCFRIPVALPASVCCITYMSL